jgi:uncharacterized membrane protein YqgA involved in biofilm formation
MGTILNALAIVIGGLIGMFLGNRLPARVRETVINGIGLAVIVIGIQMALKTQNIMIPLAAILVGGIIGELIGIERGLEWMGKRIEKRFAPSEDADIDITGEGQVVVEGHRSRANFTRGFVMTSVLVCVGPMAVLGSIQDGLNGDYSTLAVKSVLDGFGALAFASTQGIGVIFSALPLLIYQGAITLGASWIKDLLTQPIITELTAVGGLLIIGTGINVLEIKPIRVGNLLPALIIAPAIVAILALF